MKHIIKPAFSLFIIAAITTALLGFVFDLTKEPIENQNRLARDRTMREVLTRADSFRELNADIGGNIVKVYEGLAGGNVLGYVLELSVKGYSSDPINLMVGILREENQIAGMRILNHSETPGLGSLAARPAFYERFSGLALNPLRVVKSPPGPGEIQALTSATITTNAITSAVNEAIEWYKAYQEYIGGGG